MQDRRYDLDWLRVFAIILLHFFHSAMPFVAEWGWHIKNAEVSTLLMECSYFLSRWRMPLLFFISGVGTTFVLAKCSTGQFTLQRAKRLLVPLAFGMLVIVPPQVYFERTFNNPDYPGYAEFYAGMFASGAYPEGNLSWHHLWFIAYLFVFSVVALPLMVFLKSATGRALQEKAARMSQKYGLYWLMIPTFLAALLLFGWPEETHALVDDWATFARYLSYFAAGCFIGTNPVFWDGIRARRRHYLIMAFWCTIAVNILRWNDWEPQWDINAPTILFLGLLTLNTWMWLLALFGYANRYLNSTGTFLRYANEGIYPFYILHQTIIVIIAWYAVQTTDTVIVKYAFVALVSFALTLGLYEFIVRPNNVMRFLFGMKPKPKNKDKNT